MKERDGLERKFEIKEEHIVEGITEDYVWYHSNRLVNQMRGWQLEFERVVKVMGNRHTEHLKMIDVLIMQNKVLKAKLKGEKK